MYIFAFYGNDEKNHSFYLCGSIDIFLLDTFLWRYIKSSRKKAYFEYCRTHFIRFTHFSMLSMREKWQFDFRRNFIAGLVLNVPKSSNPRTKIEYIICF